MIVVIGCLSNFYAISALPNELVQDSKSRQISICASKSVKEPPTSKDERLPPLPFEAMTEDQRNAVASIASGPRGCLFGPFSVLLRSPELLERTQQLGAYLRFRSVVPLHYRELAILITGKFWKSPYVWYVHEPVARSSGLSREIIEFIAKDQGPALMSDLEAGVYESVNDILNARQISDGNYRKLIEAFGEEGTIELVSIVGYFTMLAMTLNVAGTPVPDDYSGSLGNIHNLGRIDN